VDFEQAIETQRLRLLRILTGLVVLVGVLSAYPVSRCFSVSVCQFVGSILLRAETAARYLVIAQARMMGARRGIDVGFSESLAFIADDADVSVSECQRRLRALRAVLMDLPRCVLRLLRRIKKQSRVRVPRPSLCSDARISRFLRGWRLAGTRVERPPDNELSSSASNTLTATWQLPPCRYSVCSITAVQTASRQQYVHHGWPFQHPQGEG